MTKKDSLNSKVLESSNISSSLYQSSPRMIPIGMNPECLPIFIKPQPKTPKSKALKKVKPVERKPRKKKNAASEDEPQASTSKEDCLLPGPSSKMKVKLAQVQTNYLNIRNNRILQLLSTL